MNALIAMWRDNPVMVKEFRVRMRGARAYWIITGYLAFLSFILFMRYTIWWNATQAEGHNLAGSSKIGQDFLMWITITQAFLVAFITPAITSGAITIEREQRTLEMLEMTRLSPGHVVLGKLLSAVGFVTLMLISSLPLASICFFLGGVSPQQIAYVYVMLIAGAFVAGTLGLVWSSVARTTAAAVVLTYASLLSPFIFAFLGIIVVASSSGAMGFDFQLVLDNFLGVFGIPLTGEEYSPIAPYFQFWDHSRYFGLVVPPWLPGLLSFGLIGLVLAATTAVRLAPRPETRSRTLRWLIVFLFVEQMFFLFGARFCPYSSAAPAAIGAMLSGYPVLWHALYPVLLLFLLAPVFSTGDLRASEARAFGKYLARGWKKLGWGTARLTAGWPYLCALALVIVGMLAFSFVVVGHGSEAMSLQIGGAPPPAPVAAGGGSGFIVTPGMKTAIGGAAQQGPVLAQLALLLIATVTGLFFAGVFLSLACGNRWVAMILMYAGILVILVVPFLALASYKSAIAAQEPPGALQGLLVNLFYLNPMVSMVAMGDNTGTAMRGIPLAMSGIPPWQVTTVLYSGITVISSMLSAPFVTRTAARPVLPYEEIGARA